MEIGKDYQVLHTRKGRFDLHVESINDGWITGVIIGGKAKYMSANSDREAGEEITIRKTLISSFKELTAE